MSAVKEARERCVDTFDDSAARPGNEAAFSSDLDALMAAARAEGRADTLAAVRTWAERQRHPMHPMEPYCYASPCEACASNALLSTLTAALAALTGADT